MREDLTKEKALDVTKAIFIKGVCLTYHPKHQDLGIELAERAWEATYKVETEILIEEE